ncbi:MAG: glycosyltransferase [Eubacterium sp.]|nr:glycosyltransferase [Eubacterium sp.]
MGVGAARNTGLSYVTGDYATFLDSDDEWMNDFCENLLAIIGDADIAVAGRATYVNGVFTKSKTAPSIEIVDTATAIQYVLQGKYSAHPVWGKLFRRELLEGLKFDEQYVFEDIRYSIDTMIQAKKVVFSDKDLYLYKMRAGSIMTANAERQISGYVHAAEYVYQRLLESKWINKCNYEFRVFLARGIIRNTRQFIRHDLDTDFFKKYDSRIVDLFESLGGL